MNKDEMSQASETQATDSDCAGADIFGKHREHAQKVLWRLLTEATKKHQYARTTQDITYTWAAMNSKTEMDFRCLHLWASIPLRDGDSMKALAQMIDQGLTDVDSFSRIAKTIVRTVPARQLDEYRFVLPFNAVFSTNCQLPKTVRILGTQFKIFDSKSRVRHIPRKAIINQLNSRGIVSHDDMSVSDKCVWTTVVGKGSTHLEAWDTVEHSHDVFRGIWELLHHFGRRYYRSTGSPLSAIPHPAWSAAVPRETDTVKLIEFMVPDPKFDFRSQATIEPEGLDAFLRNAKWFSRKIADDNDINAVLVNSLRLFAQAVDTVPRHQCFLGLWQCIEAFTLVDRYQGNHMKAKSRLAHLLDQSGIYDATCLRRIIDDLYEIRNAVVHTGRHERVRTFEIGWAKEWCELSLVWLIRNSRDIRSREELDSFYELSSLNNKALKAKVRAIQYIQNRRHPGTKLG